MPEKRKKWKKTLIKNLTLTLSITLRFLLSKNHRQLEQTKISSTSALSNLKQTNKYLHQQIRIQTICWAICLMFLTRQKLLTIQLNLKQTLAQTKQWTLMTCFLEQTRSTTNNRIKLTSLDLSTQRSPLNLCSLRLKLLYNKTTHSWLQPQLNQQLRIRLMHFQLVPSTNPLNNLLPRTTSSSPKLMLSTSSNNTSSQPNNLSSNNSRPQPPHKPIQASAQGWTPSQRQSRTVTRNQPLNSSRTLTKATCSSSGRLALRSNNNSSRVTLPSISTSECWYLKYPVEPKAY
jgi:hypothetical protein